MFSFLSKNFIHSNTNDLSFHRYFCFLVVGSHVWILFLGSREITHNRFSRIDVIWKHTKVKPYISINMVDKPDFQGFACLTREERDFYINKYTKFYESIKDELLPVEHEHCARLLKFLDMLYLFRSTSCIGVRVVVTLIFECIIQANKIFFYQ